MEMDEAIGEGVAFLEFFRDLPDPRQAGKVVYPLDGILLPCLLAVLAELPCSKMVKGIDAREWCVLGMPALWS